MNENHWIYFVKLGGHTFQASSLRAFARIALFAKWYRDSQDKQAEIDCTGYRLKGNLGFIRRPEIAGKSLRRIPRLVRADADSPLLQKIGA